MVNYDNIGVELHKTKKLPQIRLHKAGWQRLKVASKGRFPLFYAIFAYFNASIVGAIRDIASKFSVHMLRYSI